MIVNKFLDKIDVLKLKIGQDADKILEAIDIDEMLKDISKIQQNKNIATLRDAYQVEKGAPYGLT